MGNDGKIPAKDKGSYPRPLGGPEPTAQGGRSIGSGDATKAPYDYSSSLGGYSQADLARGYCPGGRVDAGGDPMKAG